LIYQLGACGELREDRRGGLVGRGEGLEPLPRWRKVSAGNAAGEVFALPDVGGLDDLATGLLVLAGAVVVAVIVIPLLLFGIELILLGFIVAAAIVGRGLLGRPWIVQARCVGEADRGLSWSVNGWRRSGRVIDEVAGALAAGVDPKPHEVAELTGR
jgi:hypothetical protein